jgi:gentisate 1,2-dioxygenase
VLTPNWQWHDHGNNSGRPMIWLDGLDIPTVRFYDASFAERLEQPSQSESIPAGDNIHRYGRNLRPFRATAAERRPAQQPIFHYPYREWRESLMAVAAADAPDAHLGHALEFINPANAGPVMPTIAAHVRHLPQGFETKPRRATDGTTFVVVEGRGSARIEGQEFRLEERDLFVVPSWNRLELRAETPLTLFGFSDKAAQEKLSLWREERLDRVVAA